MKTHEQLINNNSERYALRGHRVSPKTPSEISSIAEKFCKKFKLNSIRDIEKLFDVLSTEGLIDLDSIETSEWDVFFHFANGHFDPSSRDIRLADHVLDSIHSTDKEKQHAGLKTFLHEIGHFTLGHSPLLHESNAPPTINEDAEYQADLFAEAVLTRLGLLPRQISFDFYTKVF